MFLYVLFEMLNGVEACRGTGQLLYFMNDSPDEYCLCNLGNLPIHNSLYPSCIAYVSFVPQPLRIHKYSLPISHEQIVSPLSTHTAKMGTQVEHSQDIAYISIVIGIILYFTPRCTSPRQAQDRV